MHRQEATPSARTARGRRGWLEANLAVDRVVLEEGQPLRADVMLRNVDPRPQRIAFPTSRRFDVIIARDMEGADVVAAWSFGRESDRTFNEVTLRHQQRIDRALVIETGETAELDPEGRAQPIPPGDYYIVATTESDPFVKTTPLRIRVVPRTSAPSAITQVEPSESP